MAAGFPVTRHSVVRSLASERPDIRRAAFDVLADAYWKPVFKYVRLKWRADADEAADLTQAFFLRAYEKAFFARFDPARARFRTYLRTCLDRFIANARQESRRLKRGGGVELVPFDFEAAERELQRQHGDGVEELDRFSIASGCAVCSRGPAIVFASRARRPDAPRGSQSSSATIWPTMSPYGQRTRRSRASWR